MNTFCRIAGKLSLLCVLLSGAALQAQQPSTATKPGATAKHSLWKVKGEKASVYLLGSVHCLKKEDYPLPAPLESAFKGAQVVVFESDIDKMQDPAFMMKIATKGRLPEGQTLSDVLSPEVYGSFSNYVQKAGMPAQLLDSLTPAMAALTLVMLEMKKMGLDPEQGLDKHFFGLAREQGKTTVGLETPEFQLNLLTEFTKEEGELLMKTTLKDINVMETKLDDLLKAWKTGDAAVLEKLLNEAKNDAPVIYKRLLTDRNETWVPKIEELVKGTNQTLVVVGAGHLVGSKGVVELLKKKGYAITQE